MQTVTFFFKDRLKLQKVTFPKKSVYSRANGNVYEKSAYHLANVFRFPEKLLQCAKCNLFSSFFSKRAHKPAQKSKVSHKNAYNSTKFLMVMFPGRKNR